MVKLQFHFFLKWKKKKNPERKEKRKPVFINPKEREVIFLLFPSLLFGLTVK